MRDKKDNVLYRKYATVYDVVAFFLGFSLFFLHTVVHLLLYIWQRGRFSLFLFFGILINKRARTHDYDYAAMGDEGGARGTGGSSRNRSRDLLGVEHNERDEDVPRESRFEYLPLFPQILICNAKNKKKKKQQQQQQQQ